MPILGGIAKMAMGGAKKAMEKKQGGQEGGQQAQGGQGGGDIAKALKELLGGQGGQKA